MKTILTILLFFIGSAHIKAETLHCIIMVNKEERGREIDRTADYNNMFAFFNQISQALGYINNVKCYSGSQFKASTALNAIESLNVASNDIVIFYYSGHGANWNEDEWPHMAFLDSQYSEKTIYDNLKNKYSNAKLILCISDCCNMDSEGERRMKRTYSGFDPVNVKKLFTDFEGHRAYIASASIRGQYSYSHRQYGALYGIALRNAMQEAFSGKIQPNWQYVFEKAKTLTLEYTDNQQMPQFSIDRW